MTPAADEVTRSAQGLPPPLPRREFSAFGRVVGKTLLHGVLRPLFWLLRLVGWWPRVLGRVSERMSAEFAGYSPGAHDVLVCSYFKSGTNWTMQIAVQIAWRGAAQFDHIHDLVPWVELPERMPYAVKPCGAIWKNTPTQLQVIKTHLPIGKIEYNEHGRYIWVVRDPKDVCVSGYHFLRSIMLGPLMPSVEEWLDIFLSEHAFTGSWAEHLHAGWQLRDRSNVAFLTFEEMKQDRYAAIDRIAEVMRVDLSAREREAVAAQSAYEYMKTISHKFDTIGLSPPWVNPRGTMVRRGRAGGSAELLTPAQQQRIDDYWRGELRRLGCDFPWEQHFA